MIPLLNELKKKNSHKFKVISMHEFKRSVTYSCNPGCCHTVPANKHSPDQNISKYQTFSQGASMICKQRLRSEVAVADRSMSGTYVRLASHRSGKNRPPRPDLYRIVRIGPALKLFSWDAPVYIGGCDPW